MSEPKCGVCVHPDRPAIEERLLSGEGVRAVGERFGIPKSTLHDHRKAGHVTSKELADSVNAEKVAEGAALLVKVQDLEGEIRRLAQKAEKNGDVRGAVTAMRELSRVLELLGRISGELKNRSESTVHLDFADPETTLRMVLVELERRGYRVIPPGEQDSPAIETTALPALPPIGGLS